MKRQSLIPLSLLLLVGPAIAGDTPAEGVTLPAANNSPDAFAPIMPILDVRTRYEFRDEDGFDASHALTTRARLGLKTKEWNGWSALAEMEGTHAFVDDYRSNPTGSNATSPYVPNNTVVFDPENIELNRGWIQYQAGGFAVKVGRQRIVLNNQALVGTVGWRQNEQTFDAVSLSYTGDNYQLYYAYANRAQRIFGNDGDDAPAGSPLKNFEGDFHFFDVTTSLGGGTFGGVCPPDRY